MTFKIQSFVISCLVFGLILASPGWSSATSEWYWCHGHSAKVEYPERTTMFYKGWGLDFDQIPGTVNWIHFAIPTPTNLDARQMNARFIKVRFWTGSIDAFISDAHVYNGETKVREFTNLGWADGWQTRTLDLGSLVNFDKGIGVSLKVQAGVEMMSHRFIFSGAGARFEW